MVQMTFYGGINEIGGNKILLEDDSKKLFMDFGFPYKRHKMFYEEYLSPRNGAGLLDPLAMGLIPPLEGLYREDLDDPSLWQRFRDNPLYRKLENIDGILLSHSHLDHSGHISFIKGNIPVYSTAATALLTKAIQESGKSGLEQQICFYNPVSYGIPTGWRQSAYLSAGTSTPAEQRQFCIGNINPGNLNNEAKDYWNSGFWEKTARQKSINSRPLENHHLSVFNLKCLPVDHSIPGACAWAIETDSGWIIYSGDLRLHGKRSHLTRKFIEEASRLKPVALIIEGTNAGRSKNVSEQDVYNNAIKAISEAKGLVIADFSPRDMDRLLTFLQIAGETSRKLAILPKDAYLLKTLHLIDPEIPDIAKTNNLCIYQKTTSSKFPDKWMVNIFGDYQEKVVLADDIHNSQDEYILSFSFFDLNELPSIRPVKNSLYVFSSSEPHDEEQEIDFRRLHEWLRHFSMKSIGLPVETKGNWQIQENETGLHASGHACGTDLLDIAREINPEILIPVHSEQPEFYKKNLSGTSINVIIPRPGGTIVI
jgi:ribonuclease J